MADTIWRLVLVVLICAACTSEPARPTKRQIASYPLTNQAQAVPPETDLLSKLMWPVTRHRITQSFRPQSQHRKAHDGIDLSAPRGTRIFAPADGTVLYAGKKFHGYGKMVMIEHNSKLTTLFAHCHKLLVKAGQKVRRGTLIALVGATGRATAPHLHFEVRVDRDPHDPLEFLP